MSVTLIALSLLAAPDWQQLFNGKNLDGWEQRGGKATYRIEGKDIVGRTVAGTPNSFLCTKRPYADFELEFDVMVDPNLNSGVQIRSASVPGYKEGVVHGYQVEIDPLDPVRTADIHDEARRGWLGEPLKSRAKAKGLLKGKWNHYRVVAMGDRIQTWLNKEAVADLRDDLTGYGFIGLQVHSHQQSGLEVRWRNLKIKDLGFPYANPPKGAHWLMKESGDLKNWESEARPGQPCPWQWVDGAMQGVPGSGDIVTKEKFTDCRLHMEFMVDENGKTGQENGNSGVYMMQSYETQILNSVPRGPLHNECGGIYGVKAPDYAMAMPAGVWQTYDIWFKAPTWDDTRKVSEARITVIHNGTLIHRDVVIPTNTGAGLGEAPQARPIRLQDHGHKIRFRNMWVAPNLGVW